MKTKKRLFFLSNLIFIILVSNVFAGSLDLKPYGFIKSDFVYSIHGVYSWGNPANNYLSAPHFASQEKFTAFGFTAQHTRFGLNGTAGDNFKVSGILEIDFYHGSFDSNAKPRMRLAYVTMRKGPIEIRLGQQWDIYSPINATTTNTSGNLWYAGNKGGRRAQMQGWYHLGNNDNSPMIQLSIGEATKETAGLGEDNLSKIPMLQGRLSAKFMKKHTLGLFFAYAAFSPNPSKSESDYHMRGFGMDFNLKFNPKFILKGELNGGSNLNNANFFTITSNGSKHNEMKSMGVWFNALLYPSKMVHLVAAFGRDKNQSSKIPPGDITQNTVMYGDIIFSLVHGFSVTLELMNITTHIQNGDTNSALILMVSGKIGF